MSQTSSQSHSMGRVKLSLITALALMGQYASGATIVIAPPTTIQSAVDSAMAGDTIKVKAGTYNEQVIINKDRLTLIGTNAILMPPTPLVVNGCGTVPLPNGGVGFCVAGGVNGIANTGTEHIDVDLTGALVKGVTISGFTVSGFTGANIMVLGGKDTTISKNQLIDGSVFGILSVTSVNTMGTGNDIFTSVLGTTGIGTDDTGASSFTNNNVTGYATGVRIETSSAIVKGNTIKNSCMGIIVNPAVAGATVSTNHISNVNAVCSLSPNSAKPAGGVYVNGGVKSSIVANVASNLHRAGNAAGITLADSTSPASVASENKVTYNVLIGDDVSIKKTSTGTGNAVNFNF